MKRAALIIAVLLTACPNDDGRPSAPRPDAGAPPDAGDPCALDSTFTALHAQIFGTPTCTRGAGCHGDAPEGGLDLMVDIDAAYTAVTGDTVRPGTAAKDRYPKRIVAGAPDMSWFWIKLSEPAPPGGRMPLGGMLRQCELDAVERWVRDGAKKD